MTTQDLPVTFIQSCSVGPVLSISFDKDRVICGSKSMKIPVYSSLNDEIHQQSEKRRLLQQEYSKLTCDLMSNKHVDREVFDNIAHEIISIDEAIDKLLHTVHSTANDYVARDETQVKIEELRKASTKERVAQLHKEFLRSVHKEQIISNIGLMRYGEYELAIAEPPPSQRRPYTPNISKEAENAIVNNIEQLLKDNFRFKTVQECTSKERSKQYYTTKEEIIKKINEDERLKNAMPNNFKNLTKEKLCEFFYKIRNQPASLKSDKSSMNGSTTTQKPNAPKKPSPKISRESEGATTSNNNQHVSPRKSASSSQPSSNTNTSRNTHQPKSPPKISKTAASAIADNIEQLLKEKFKFTNTQECASKERSKEYFSTREYIIQKIDEDERLKKLMPKNYKSLTKEKLCEHFYTHRRK